jgi:hypothetical protein
MAILFQCVRAVDGGVTGFAHRSEITPGNKNGNEGGDHDTRDQQPIQDRQHHTASLS